MPAKFANTWFGADERVMALTMTVVAESLGTGLGFKLPVFFIKQDDTKEMFKDNIVKVLAC